jgi:hypothetical protein
MLTKAQKAYFDEVVARAGKPSAALQLQIDQLRAAKTEDELREIFFRDADVARPKIEAELLCAVMLAKQVELNPSINAKSLKEEQHDATNHAVMERVGKVKVEKTPAFSKENREPQTKQKEFFNLIKAIGIIVLIFFGAVALLSAIFDKKHTGQAIEYTIIYTTINGQYYEKEETAEDLNSEYVTFSDGTRVSWTAVKTKKAKFYPDELGIKTNANQ